MKDPIMKNIVCIGAGYVGGPTMAKIAEKCPGIRVTVVDINEKRIAAWAAGTPPIYEPGLDEIVAKALGRNLYFSTDVRGELAKADMVFICVNTPTKTFGEGAGCASDVSFLEKTARMIKECASRNLIVVEKSTVPVRTAEVVDSILHSGDSQFQHEVLSNPEFLAEGTAMKDLDNPDRVLVGGGDTPAGRAAVQALVDVYAHWVPRERILVTSTWSSELSKLVANAFLAQRVSSINSISALCEKTGADVREISRAIGMDARIGSRFLNASVGFGGSCFKKDILNLVYICRKFGLPEVATYWQGVVDINEWQQDRFVSKMNEAMFGSLSGKRIAILGLAFKADTGDVRESPALKVIRGLLGERAEIAAFDPEANDNSRLELGELASKVQFCASAEEAMKGAHAVAVLTEWRVFRHLDFAAAYSQMAKPAFIFDGRNILDHAALRQIGFHVQAIGSRPS